MFVVAVAEVVGSLEDEAAALSGLVGKTAYELRVLLSGALPRVVYQCASHDDSERVLAAIRGRGHGALAVHTEDVIPRSSKLAMHRFTFDDVGLHASAPLGKSDQTPTALLPWGDVAAVVVLAARTDVLRTTTEVRVSTRLRREPDVVVEHTAREHLVDHLAYLVPRHGSEVRERAWVLSERESQYLALGPLMRPTRHENFHATLKLLADRAPHAVVDDRFARSPQSTTALLSVRGNDTAVSRGVDMGVELLVHLLATWLLRPGSSA